MMLRVLAPLFSLLLAVSPLALHAQAVEMVFGPADQGKEKQIHVRAAEVEFDQNEGLAHFTGDVEVTHGVVQLRCSQAVVYTNVEDSEILSITLEGGLDLETDRGSAQAQRGEYDVVEGVIRMAGSVTVQSGQSRFSAEGLIYNVNTGRSRLISNAQIAISGDD